MYSSGQNRTRTRNFFIGDHDSVGEPSSPPAVRPDRDDGVITERRDGQVDGCRVADRENHVWPGEVFPTPANFVAHDDELNSFQTVCEVRHGASEIVQGRSSPTFPDMCFVHVVPSTNMDYDSYEVLSFPLCRRNLQTRALFYGRLTTIR